MLLDHNFFHRRDEKYFNHSFFRIDCLNPKNPEKQTTKTIPESVRVNTHSVGHLDWLVGWTGELRTFHHAYKSRQTWVSAHVLCHRLMTFQTPTGCGYSWRWQNNRRWRPECPYREDAVNTCGRVAEKQHPGSWTNKLRVISGKRTEMDGFYEYCESCCEQKKNDKQVKNY